MESSEQTGFGMGSSKKDKELEYQSHSKHTVGGLGNRPNAGIEPKNSLELFNDSIVAHDGVRYAKDANGNLHRFFPPSAGNPTWHWSGGSGQGANSLESKNIPIEIRRALNMPSKGW